jgi:DNA-binding NarL/FixJ family response regulator
MKVLNHNILLVDDHLLLRKGLELIKKANILKLKFLRHRIMMMLSKIVRTIKADIIILDIIMKGKEDITVMNRIKKLQHTKI